MRRGGGRRPRSCGSAPATRRSCCGHWEPVEELRHAVHPPTHSRQDEMTTAVVALDVGGTTLKGAVVDRSGAALTTVRAPTPRADGAAAVVEAVVATAARLRDEAERLTGAPPAAAGVASLGLVDDAAGVARFSTTIGWRDVPLRDRVAERLGVPVWLTHDVRAGAEAEAALGAGRGHPDFVFV